MHEFGHAYFMGILATNEFEEPRLDEGINSFFEQRIMDHYYGPGFGFVNHPVLKISAKEFSRKTYINSNVRQIASNGNIRGIILSIPIGCLTTVKPLSFFIH